MTDQTATTSTLAMLGFPELTQTEALVKLCRRMPWLIADIGRHSETLLASDLVLLIDTRLESLLLTLPVELKADVWRHRERWAVRSGRAYATPFHEAASQIYSSYDDCLAESLSTPSPCVAVTPSERCAVDARIDTLFDTAVKYAPSLRAAYANSDCTDLVRVLIRDCSLISAQRSISVDKFGHSYLNPMEISDMFERFAAFAKLMHLDASDSPDSDSSSSASSATTNVTVPDDWSFVVPFESVPTAENCLDLLGGKKAKATGFEGVRAQLAAAFGITYQLAYKVAEASVLRDDVLLNVVRGTFRCVTRRIQAAVEQRSYIEPHVPSSVRLLSIPVAQGKVSDLETKIGYVFKNKQFAMHALTPTSDQLGGATTQIRCMALIGDAFMKLHAAVAGFKFGWRAQQISRIYTIGQNNAALAHAAKFTGLYTLVNADITSRKSFADLVEATIGAVYLDSGANFNVTSELEHLFKYNSDHIANYLACADVKELESRFAKGLMTDADDWSSYLASI